MGEFYDWIQVKPKAKRPPPAHGIRVAETGSTWWGKRWLEALERISEGYSSRLSRGKTYARAGRVHDLIAKAGEVTAHVTGSSRNPYRVRINLVKLGDATWKKASYMLSSKARFSAELLDGHMPHEIDEAFREAGAKLFPMGVGDLATDCSCPDTVNPCKHVAAVHYVLGEAIDRDPFLLLELRGRTKEQVLAGIRKGRAGTKPTVESDTEQNVASVDLGTIEAAKYDVLRAPFPALHLVFEENLKPGMLLRQLGNPPGWSNAASIEEMLGPIVRAAAEKARSLATEEAQSGHG